VPQTDKHQTVRVLTVKAPAKTQMTQESEYGNRMMYAEINNPATSQTEFALEYEVARREYSRVTTNNWNGETRSLASYPPP